MISIIANTLDLFELGNLTIDFKFIAFDLNSFLSTCGGFVIHLILSPLNYYRLHLYL